ncbi:MAG: metalloregulator ArsR/SmtB family transcription factor [Magnetococcales bacterium]|nr:metalloregulator ArsR/SmtB family transcription factor [Magnetococcales bacterium]MBF0437672.1 metalloregulator ArsR/SmtB family transcription factor [Magnetococcales bacterium]
MLTPEILMQTLVDETRLRCVMLVMSETELCVCEFGYALGEVQPKISRHLGKLRESKVMQDRRTGQWVHYRLHPELPPWAKRMLEAVAQGLEGAEIYKGDLERLRTMPDRPGRCFESGSREIEQA